MSYPSELEADIALRNGSVVHVRPVRAEDESGLLTFLRALPEEDRLMRFFGLGNDLARTAHQQAYIDYSNTMALVATTGPLTEIVGHAMYARTEEATAEVAFEIARRYQGQGLATLMLGQLAQAAWQRGIHTFQAVVLPDNRRMLEVLRSSGFPVKARYASDTVEVTFPTALTPAALSSFEDREQLASASALRRMLYPSAVAVVGASDRPGSVGNAVMRNLLGAHFQGKIYPVNPSGVTTVASLQAYPSIGEVPGRVDLAVIAVPATKVSDVVAECGRKDVYGLVILTAGFAEIGAEGQQRQREMLQAARQYGMRIIGPNCIGIINTDPTARLNATFGPLMPASGPVGMATQSGALGLAAIDFTAARGLGFSSLVSMGNKADISGNDLLGYWQSDPRTDVILLYLESFGNPRKFGRLARSIGRTKPIVALKSGRSSVGARATTSHTGALLSASDITVDALFRQAGVIRTDTLEEMLDVAELLAYQPLPRGRCVAIVTNVGGPAVMCADTCEARGLEVPSLTAGTQVRLRDFLPVEASVVNPVDMLAAATAEQYAEAVHVVADDPGVDAVISIFLPPLATRPVDVAQALVHANIDKPLLGVFMSAEQLPDLRTPSGGRVAGYHMPEPAAIALARVARYVEWRTSPLEESPTFADIHTDDVGMILTNALQRGGGWLDPEEVRRVLSLYGVAVIEQKIAGTPAEAGRAAAQLGGMVALKAIAPGLIHKSDVGAVRLNLPGAANVQAAAAEIAEAVPTTTGFLVQRMASPGVEMLVGMVNDSQFGPTIACGAGGALVEVMNDVAIRLNPLTRSDTATMLRELRSFRLLEGYRGSPECDIAALEDVILRISSLAGDHAAIAELDCNPVIVGAAGAVVVDARIRVAVAPRTALVGARRQ
jgi:acetate---CoA ligase (ADP-forming)